MEPFYDEFAFEKSQGRGVKIDIAKIIAEIKVNEKNKKPK